MEQESLLSDIQFNPVFASTGKRFVNYLIDVIIFYVVITFVLLGIIFGSGDAVVTSNSISASSGNAGYGLVVQLVFIGFFVAFYCLSEIIFKGRTIGKFITGTKAVNEDGTEPDPKTYFLRSLCRVVPFEPFSAFGSPSRPWHDKWTHTIVIDVKQTAINNGSQF